MFGDTNKDPGDTYKAFVDKRSLPRQSQTLFGENLLAKRDYESMRYIIHLLTSGPEENSFVFPRVSVKQNLLFPKKQDIKCFVMEKKVHSYLDSFSRFFARAENKAGDSSISKIVTIVILAAFRVLVESFSYFMLRKIG